MPAPATRAEQEAAYKLQVQALSGLNTALANTAETQRKLIQGAADRAAENWREAVSAVKGVQAAMHSGDYASARSALVGIAKIKTYEAPVDQDTLFRVQEAVAMNPATAGRSLGSPEAQQAAWLSFLRMFPGAASNEATLGTYREMVSRYGEMNEAYLVNDTVLQATWEAVRQKATHQADAMRMVKGYAEAAEDAILGLPTDAPPEQVKSALASIDTRYAPGQLSPAMQALEDMVIRGPKTDYMNPEERAQYEANKKSMASMQARIDDPAKAATGQDTRRDRIAAIIASPQFQFWAERNGFDVGTVAPAEKGVTYSEGVETPSGIYVPGPDDVRALVFAQQQMQRAKTSESQPHNPFLHRALNGERRSFGVVSVEQPKSRRPAEWAEKVRQADGTYAWAQDSAGERVPLSGGVLFMREDNGSVAAIPAAEASAVAGLEEFSGLDWETDGLYFYDPANTKAKVPENLAPLIHRESSIPLAEYDTPPLEVRGQFLAPHVGDPIGSLRVLTETGERLVLPDEMTDEPVVTSGGGPKQTLGRFVELVRGRMAHNRSERGDEVHEIADRAAERVVPAQYSKGEQEALRLRNEQTEMQDRAAGAAAETAGTTPTRLRSRALADEQAEEAQTAEKVQQALAADEQRQREAEAWLWPQTSSPRTPQERQHERAQKTGNDGVGLRTSEPLPPPGTHRTGMSNAPTNKAPPVAPKTPSDGVISGVSDVMDAAAADAASSRPATPSAAYGTTRLLQRRRQNTQ